MEEGERNASISQAQLSNRKQCSWHQCVIFSSHFRFLEAAFVLFSQRASHWFKSSFAGTDQLRCGFHKTSKKLYNRFLWSEDKGAQQYELLCSQSLTFDAGVRRRKGGNDHHHHSKFFRRFWGNRPSEARICKNLWTSSRSFSKICSHRKWEFIHFLRDKHSLVNYLWKHLRHYQKDIRNNFHAWCILLNASVLFCFLSFVLFPHQVKNSLIHPYDSEFWVVLFQKLEWDLSTICLLPSIL